MGCFFLENSKCWLRESSKCRGIDNTSSPAKVTHRARSNSVGSLKTYPTVKIGPFTLSKPFTSNVFLWHMFTPFSTADL